MENVFRDLLHFEARATYLYTERQFYIVTSGYRGSLEDYEPCILSYFSLPRPIFVTKKLVDGRWHGLALQPILAALNFACAAHR